MNNNNNSDNNQDQQEDHQQHQEQQQQQQEQQQQQDQQNDSEHESDFIDDEEQEEQEQEQEEEEEEEEEEKELMNKDEIGCKHYKRRCHIKSPCCQQWYQCRLCHDEDEDKKCVVDKLDRYSITRVKCDNCLTEQTPSNECCNPQCLIKFAPYFCRECVLYTDDTVHKVFHCEHCRLCRLGNKQDYFHCFTCQVDLSISAKSTHRCRENVYQNNCFLCLESLFDSRKHTTQLPKCLHVMHQHCLNQYLIKQKGFPNCPICGQSIQKEPEQIIKMIDKQVEESWDKVPAELKDKKLQVLCNNCMKKTQDIPFNFYGLKCKHCGSYNTKEYI